MMRFRHIAATILSIAAMFTSGCVDDFDPIADDDNVVYMGTFMRGGPLIDPLPSNVTIRFRDGVFEGTSDAQNYPAICNGTYTVKGDEISFRNKCVFPANFDWSFIMAGEFEYEQRGDSLMMRRSYEGGNYDQYMLKKAG